MIINTSFIPLDQFVDVILFKGHIFIENILVSDVDILKAILNNLLNEKKKSVLEIFRNSSGFFCLVIAYDHKIIVVSDIIRSKPLFIVESKQVFWITDNPDEYQKKSGAFPIQNEKLEQYIASGFVYGNGTVYKNVYALQAGEIVTIEGDEITSNRYFEYRPSEKQMFFKTIADFSAVLDQVFLSVFSRMVTENKNVNRWIIPLSGGHDSRIIVNYFYRLGVKNVACFSYGTPDNEQSRISRQVAEALGFPWHFVEYTEEKWLQLHDNELIEDYILYSFNGVSTPHLQDFLAVYELKQQGILQEGDIFVPGHTLDFITGGHFSQLDTDCNTKEKAVKRNYLRHSRIRDDKKAPIRSIENIYDESKTKPIYFQEYFNWQERQAKFIVNSIRAYEYFGFETNLPFWDKELVDFWLKIPDENRIGRKIFFEAEKNVILNKILLDIPFAGAAMKNQYTGLEKKFKNILPDFVIELLLKISKRKLKLNEGLNQIYALKAKNVKELLEPVDDFAEQIRPYFNEYLERYPYQMDYHFLTVLYTMRIQYDDYKK